MFLSSHMYPENPEETRLIFGSMNMGYVFDTARNRTHNLFRPKCAPIPPGHAATVTDSSSSGIVENLLDTRRHATVIEKGYH